MIINLSPMCDPHGVQELTVDRYGQTLVINGQSFDFSVIPTGATLHDGRGATGCPYVSPVAPIERDNDGVLHISLILPHAADAPESARFPQPIIDPPDGPIALPQTNWPKAPIQVKEGVEDGDD